MTDGLAKTSLQHYEIRVLGRIDPQWSDWLGGLDLTILSDAEGRSQTVLSGPLADQAALFGVLNRIRDLGFRLVSVCPVPGQVFGSHEEKRKEVSHD